MHARCRNCEQVLFGAYCHACGQRAFADADRRLGHLLGQFFAAATDLDGRFWRSLRWLLLRPGALTRDYLQGRRRRWLAPLSMFLLVNVVYFVVSPISDFNLSLNEQFDYQPWGAWAREVVDQRLAMRGISLEQYTADYAALSEDVAKSLLIWHIPWLALGLMLIFPDRKLYFAEHSVAASNGISFVLVVILLLAAIGSVLGLLGLAHVASTVSPAAVTLLLILYCLFDLARRAYQVAWWRALLSLPLMFLAFMLAHFSYRAAQFVVVFLLS